MTPSMVMIRREYLAALRDAAVLQNAEDPRFLAEAIVYADRSLEPVPVKPGAGHARVMEGARKVTVFVDDLEAILRARQAVPDEVYERLSASVGDLQ